MPLKDLLNAIEAEAKEERERLRAESEAEAAAIVAAAREEAERAREGILRARIPPAEAEAARRVAVARLEAGRISREAREEALSFLLTQVRSRFAAAREEPGYQDAVRALFEEALVALPDARTVRVAPQDEGLARPLARERGLGAEADAGVAGGVVLESGDGRVVRNTLEERLANAEPRLRPWYGRRLEALVSSAAGAR